MCFVARKTKPLNLNFKVSACPFAQDEWALLQEVYILCAKYLFLTVARDKFLMCKVLCLPIRTSIIRFTHFTDSLMHFSFSSGPVSLKPIPSLIHFLSKVFTSASVVLFFFLCEVKVLFQ